MSLRIDDNDLLYQFYFWISIRTETHDTCYYSYNMDLAIFSLLCYVYNIGLVTTWRLPKLAQHKYIETLGVQYIHDQQWTNNIAQLHQWYTEFWMLIIVHGQLMQWYHVVWVVQVISFLCEQVELNHHVNVFDFYVVFRSDHSSITSDMFVG